MIRPVRAPSTARSSSASLVLTARKGPPGERGPFGPAETDEVLATLARRARDLHQELSFLIRANDDTFVYYVESRGRGLFLRASPIDVSRLAKEALFDRMRTTVLTSATLTVDRSFAYVRGRLGLKKASEVRLDSEFDYARQSILYLPRNMPDPRSPEFVSAAAGEVIEILKRTRGRA